MPTNDLENMPTLIVRKESIQAGAYEFPYNGDNLKKKKKEKPACIKVPINMSQFNKVNNSSTYIVHLFLKFI